ncbi:hypothetical protein GCM10014715_18470 [Streptomyces spiralis]|uniref:Uncharacterized protein n=1 Tax=Streptomyces spiralis TaxID=66376 RepID=A0A918ZS30_9ACTN|nr:hypothetical protein [Streptomyces spiralis]GHE65197.1 hypothetical protein GCM10014715_18470 [Streptomyces spiralis]
MSDVVIPAELPEDEEQPSGQAEVRVWTSQDDQSEVPTSGASVSFKIEKLGAEAGIEVPPENAGQLIAISPLMLGMVSSTAGPIILLNTTASLEMHWSAKFALALILAVIPIVYVLLGNRRNEA